MHKLETYQDKNDEVDGVLQIREVGSDEGCAQCQSLKPLLKRPWMDKRSEKACCDRSEIKAPAAKIGSYAIYTKVRIQWALTLGYIWGLSMHSAGVA